MPEYVEIEHVQEIARLNRALDQRLRSALLNQEARVVGYPQGSFSAQVRFARKTGDEVFWWYPLIDTKKRHTNNLFGHGAPAENKNLNIEVQFNLPLKIFSRRHGGTFIRHRRSGKVFLAHRGIATLGHGRVKKADLFNTVVANLCDVETSAGDDEMILIAGLKSRTLIADISSFATELRRAAKVIGATTVRSGTTRTSTNRAAGRRRKRSLALFG